MTEHEPLHALRERLSRAVRDNLADLDWGIIGLLPSSSLRVDIFFEEAEAALSVDSPASSVNPILSETIDLSNYVSPGSPHSSFTFEMPDQASASTSSCHQNDLISESSPSMSQEDLSLVAEAEDNQRTAARKRKRNGVAGLRPARTTDKAAQMSPGHSDSRRQITVTGNFPKRAKAQPEADTSAVSRQDSFDKFVVSIWNHIHGGIDLEPESLLEQWQLTTRAVTSSVDAHGSMMRFNQPGTGPGNLHHPVAFNNNINNNNHMATFNSSNIFCRKITQASRACRALEVIVQARWIEHFDAHIELLALTLPALSPTKRRKAALLEACNDFRWSEKELRNKMAIWRGYKEIKDAGGWASLVFAGIGLYRFCKYRVGFTPESMAQLRVLRPRLEVAADTLHPSWRQLLLIVGESPQHRFYGHPHDWVVFQDGSDPIPLRNTYLEYDPLFTFEHINDSIVDLNAWEPGDDPRWIPPVSAVVSLAGQHLCRSCGQQQSQDPTMNSCYCFPSHFGTDRRSPCPVQVYRTTDGRGNGLLALCPFERGAVIGEFVGLITKDLKSLDVVQSSTAVRAHQTWQGRHGNFTRFINHSCKANAQFQEFVWLDVQRIMLVSKGIAAGQEVTVDYSDSYWQGLDKECLCGESCCRYRSN